LHEFILFSSISNTTNYVSGFLEANTHDVGRPTNPAPKQETFNLFSIVLMLMPIFDLSNKIIQVILKYNVIYTTFIIYLFI